MDALIPLGDAVVRAVTELRDKTNSLWQNANTERQNNKASFFFHYRGTKLAEEAARDHREQGQVAMHMLGRSNKQELIG